MERKNKNGAWLPSANVIVSGMAAKAGKGFTYWQFLLIGAPITLVSLAISHLYILIRYL